MAKTYWYPVMPSKRVKSTPVRFVLNGVPLVLFRTPMGVSCLKDICPHRVAPLSQGRIVNGEIECPYHGWRFNGSGQCTAIPLLEGKVPNRFVPALNVRELHGLIFVTQNPTTAEPIHTPKWDDQPFVRSIMEIECESTLEDAVENVLDPIHTLFVHRGLLRGSRKRTSKLKIDTTVQNGVLEIAFSGEQGQDGVLSRLIEGERAKSVSSFRMPGVVELEYWGPKNLNLVTTLYFTPMRENYYKCFAVMTGPNSYGTGYLKALVFVPIMRKVITQDREIMGASYRNWRSFGAPLPARSPLDVFRPGIEAVVQGHEHAGDHIVLDI